MGADSLGRAGIGQVHRDVRRTARQRLGERPQSLLAARDENQLDARLACEAPRRSLRRSRSRRPSPARDPALSPIGPTLVKPSCSRRPAGILHRPRGRDPPITRQAAADRRPLRTRGAGRCRLARGSVLRHALRRRPWLLDRQDRRGRATAGRGRPHRRDRPRRHPYRREGLPLLLADRRLGPADTGRTADRRADQGRRRAWRRRPQADPPARSRPAQEGGRAERPAHRRRRRLPRGGG